jgi:hypothetical protein
MSSRPFGEGRHGATGATTPLLEVAPLVAPFREGRQGRLLASQVALVAPGIEKKER